MKELRELFCGYIARSQICPLICGAEPPPLGLMVTCDEVSGRL